MSRKLEDRIAEARDMKDVSARVWLVGSTLSGIGIAYGIIMKNIDAIGFSGSLFVICTIASLLLFSHYDDKDEKLTEELERQTLEERIEELEQSF